MKVKLLPSYELVLIPDSIIELLALQYWNNKRILGEGRLIIGPIDESPAQDTSETDQTLLNWAKENLSQDES